LLVAAGAAAVVAEAADRCVASVDPDHRRSLSVDLPRQQTPPTNRLKRPSVSWYPSDSKHPQLKGLTLVIQHRLITSWLYLYGKGTNK